MSDRDETFSPQTPSLKHKRILIVEDEFFLANELAQDFESLGAEVVGPVPTPGEAFRALADGEPLDGAVLDINLGGEMVFTLAEELLARGVPMVFSTGYERWSVPAAYQGVPFCEKPVDSTEIAKALFG